MAGKIHKKEGAEKGVSKKLEGGWKNVDGRVIEKGVGKGVETDDE